MKLPKPIKRIAIKIIGFVLSVPLLKKAVKCFLPKESRLYQKLYRGYHGTIAPVSALEYAPGALEQTLRTVSLEQLRIFHFRWTQRMADGRLYTQA